MSDQLKYNFVEQSELPDDAMAYTGEIIFNDHGDAYYVIDLENLDMSQASPARKKETTLVYKAVGGEKTAQVFPSGNETNIKWPYEAVKGDAIFVQGNIEACEHFMATGIVPDDLDGNLDIYVPDNAQISPDGRLKFADIEQEGYEIGTIENDSATQIKVYSPQALMLFPPNTNSQPACIKSEKDDTQHKFFPAGAAFKSLDGKISGINPDAVDTWEITPQSKLRNGLPNPELE